MFKVLHIYSIDILTTTLYGRWVSSSPWGGGGGMLSDREREWLASPSELTAVCTLLHCNLLSSPWNNQAKPHNIRALEKVESVPHTKQGNWAAHWEGGISQVAAGPSNGTHLQQSSARMSSALAPRRDKIKIHTQWPPKGSSYTRTLRAAGDSAIIRKSDLVRPVALWSVS